MKALSSISSLVAIGLWTAILATNAQVNVTQKNNNLSRDGLYIDAAFTPGNAANLARDMNFNGTISGNVYAQPLYIEGGPSGRARVVVVTESNNIYALDAITGTVIWQRNVGAPVTSGLPCGNISPLGITGTPVVHLASRSLLFDAMINGVTKKHFIYSLNVDTGATNPGWPVDVNAAARYNSITFTSSIQNQRAALGLVNGVVYVPYSGHFGDCGTYHGWVVGVPVNNPSSVIAWAPTAIGGGIWGHGGVASDGTNMFVVTGNTFNTGGNWGGGEAIIRLQAGPVFGDFPSNYWAPTNWLSLDNGDIDLGGCGPVLIDVSGATPSQLALALGKDGKAYLLNRNNLGGITAPVASANVANSVRGQSAATYHTSQGTYFVFRNGSSAVSAYKITATNPPTIIPAWTVSQNGQGSPWVTTTDGTNNAIVWVVGAGGDQRLHGYNGDTGAVIYAGGGNNELMTGTCKWNSGIVARGSIYVANNNNVYKFRVPGGTPTPTPAHTPTPTPTPTPTASPTPTTSPTKCATPHYGPAPGPYNAADYPKTIVIHCDTRGVSIRFTRDGTTPTTKHGTLIAREGTAIVSAGQTLKAIAFADGYVNSNIASGDYVSATTVGTPTFTPAGGTYRNFSGHVTIATPTAGATIRWTQDGTTPSPTHGNRLVGGTAPISIGANGIGLRAIAYKTGLTNSAVHFERYYYDPDTGGDGYLP